MILKKLKHFLLMFLTLLVILLNNPLMLVMQTYCDWKNLGGRTQLIAAIGNVFRGLMRILEPIKEAFHDIFPPVTGKLLADLTDRFLRFSHTVSPMKETVENLKRTFRGIFAVFSIVGQIVSGLLWSFQRSLR